MFAFLMLFICVILNTMLCILPFGILCLSAIKILFVKILLAVCILVGIGGLSESEFCVFGKLCPFGFFI